MKDKALQTIRAHALLQPGDRVIAAVSGGADSMALLFLLNELRAEFPLTLSAVHVNHGIRGAEAQRDADFVADACRALGVPCTVRTVSVPALAAAEKCGLEECARRARYRILHEEAHGAKIATAHTLSDQTETLLLNLTRGTGLHGLCGIPYARGAIIRPLLDCSRAEVEAFCRARGIRYVHDSTNDDPTYARNRIRTRVIPELRQLNPQLEQAVHRLSGQLRALDEDLAARADALLHAAACPGGWNAATLLAAPEPVGSRALHALCLQFGTGRDGTEHHVALLRAALTAGGGVNLPGGARLLCANGLLRAAPAAEAAPPAAPPELHFRTLPAQWAWGGRSFRLCVAQMPENQENEQKVYKISLSHALNYDTISKSEELIFRARRAGDRFRPAGRGGSKTLKKLMNEQKIPLAARARLAVLEADGELVWVQGIGASESARPQPGRPAAIITEEQGYGKSDERGY